MVRVMLVEDDPTMYQLLNTLLSLEGFEVHTALGDGDILTSVQRDCPDVVLLDVHLKVGGGKEVNGFELLKTLRSSEDLKDTKVIMSSGIDFRMKSAAEGADGFLLKPYMPDELIKMIKELVGSG
jgi:DNA-binding response OmpR family regulator